MGSAPLIICAFLNPGHALDLLAVLSTPWLSSLAPSAVAGSSRRPHPHICRDSIPPPLILCAAEIPGLEYPLAHICMVGWGGASRRLPLHVTVGLCGCGRCSSRWWLCFGHRRLCGCRCRCHLQLVTRLRTGFKRVVS